MSELVMRRAGPADADAVRALSRVAYAKWVPGIGREPRPMVADYERAVVEHRIDLLEDGSRLAALIEMKPEPDHLMIINIAVAPDRQGQGLGRRLLRHAEDVARSLGLTEMRLYTNAKMDTNVVLYEAFGYQITSREPAGDLGIVINMSKRLDA